MLLFFQYISIWLDGFCVTIWEWRQFNECNSLLDDSRIGSCINYCTFAKKILIFYANDALDSSQDLNLFDHLGISWMFYCCCDFHTTETLWYWCVMRKTVHTLNVCIDDQMLIAIFKTNEKKSQLQWHGPVYDTGKMQLLVKLFFFVCEFRSVKQKIWKYFNFCWCCCCFFIAHMECVLNIHL